MTVDSAATAAFCANHSPRYRFRIGRGDGAEPLCLCHAIVHRKILRTAVITGLVVGTILTAINQGNLIVTGHLPPVLLWKIPLTYSVPYCVSTFSALRVSLVSDRMGP